MSHSFAKRARIAYYLAWIPMADLLAVILKMQGYSIPMAIGISIIMCVPYALVCTGSYFMAKVMPLRKTNIRRVVITLHSAGALAGSLWTLLGYIVYEFTKAEGPDSFKTLGYTFFGLGLGFFLLSLAFHYIVLALEDIRKAEKQTNEAKLLTREASLRALRAQVDPHFLFNSLNAIAALTEIDSAQAQKMCLLLSGFFRATLELGKKPAISLKEEIDLATQYLDIEKVRFSDRMVFKENIDESCLHVQVPSLILQPLIENAVKHGVASVLDTAQISLNVAKAINRVAITINNDFDREHKSTTKNGFGLTVVKDRLKHFYGHDSIFTVTQTHSSFCITLEIPFEQKD